MLLVLFKQPPQTSAGRSGQEHGQSIPFATIRTHAENSRYQPLTVAPIPAPREKGLVHCSRLSVCERAGSDRGAQQWTTNEPTELARQTPDFPAAQRRRAPG